MLNLNEKPNYKNNKSLYISVALIASILILSQVILITVIVSQKAGTPIYARPQACDNFEMKSPRERAKCPPVKYTPENSIET